MAGFRSPQVVDRARTPVVRRLIQSFVSAYVGAWIGAGVVAVSGAGGPVAAVIAAAITVLGVAVGWHESRSAGPWSADEIRDGALGWGLIAAIIVVVPCFLLPLPWSVIAAILALGVVSLTVAAVRRSTTSD